MDLLIVRLKSGEELLGRVEFKGGAVHKVEKPMILIPTAEGGLNFQPFMPYTSVMEDGLFPGDYVAFTAVPEEALKEHYEINVEGKPQIAVPDKKIIV